jgi:predicted RNA-binding protein
MASSSPETRKLKWSKVMCQATVYLLRNGQREEVMREVTHLARIEEGVQLQTFFDEPRIVGGRVAEIDFLKHTVTLVSLEGEDHEPLDRDG